MSGRRYFLLKFFKLNLSVFNSIFGFPPSMDLNHRCVPKEFNPNAFWNSITRSYQYDTSNSKGTIIRNLYTRVANFCLHVVCLLKKDILNIPYVRIVFLA